MKKFGLIIALCMSVLSASAQHRHATGLRIDETAYDAVPRKATLLTRDYSVVPSKMSLLDYCPTPMSQSRFGTCTAWATAYAARTIMEAWDNGWKDKEKITREAFSPAFLYARIKDNDDDSCHNGARIDHALETMRDVGVPKRSSLDALCASYIKDSLYTEAANYKIDRFEALFNSLCQSRQEKIQSTKLSLCNSRPVIISFEGPSSLHDADECWDGKETNDTIYHAMCVVGYDDEKFGGAFLVMNSWGTDWGKDGYTWMKYDDYGRYIRWAYEPYVKQKPKPEPKPKPKPQYNLLSGNVRLQLSTGEDMEVRWTKAGQDSIPHYETLRSYVSGTRYRAYVSNNEPAFVYVLCSDLQNNVSKLFPPTDSISPALNYKQNNIALPDEQWFIEMDETRGKDYVCVLYSPNELPIKDIIEKIRSVEGNFYTKLKKALPTQLNTGSETTYGTKHMTFNSKTTSAVVAMIVEMKHD